MPLRKISQEKKSVTDAKCTFKCDVHTLPAVTRSTGWTYLGIPFAPEGRHRSDLLNRLRDNVERLQRAPLKPQQKIFALRVCLLPGLCHTFTLGVVNIGLLRKLDAYTRKTARRCLHLPADTPKAYFHADHREGGLGYPSLRWTIPEMRLRRLRRIANISPVYASQVETEIDRCTQRLNQRCPNYGPAGDFIRPSKVFQKN